MSERRFVRTSALVVRLADSGESDRVVGLFTRDFGRLSAIAKGAKRSVKRFGGALLLGQHLEVELVRSTNGLSRLESATVVAPHLALTADLGRLTEGAEILRALRDHLPEGDPDEALFDAACELLGALCKEGPSAIRLVGFRLALVDRLGIGPELDRCVRCGREARERAAAFDPRQGGVVCTACGGGPILVSARTRALAAALRAGFPSFVGVEGETDVLATALDALKRLHLAGRRDGPV